MTKLNAKDAAVLVWMEPGVTPSITTFEQQETHAPPHPNPEAWWELGAALCSSIRTDTHGKLPWIKVGRELLSPDRVSRAYEQFRNFQELDA
jgi:hypothetical protein